MLCGYAFGVQFGLGWDGVALARAARSWLLSLISSACFWTEPTKHALWRCGWDRLLLSRKWCSFEKPCLIRGCWNTDTNGKQILDGDQASSSGLQNAPNEFSVGDKTGTCLTRIVRRHPVSSEAAGTLRGREAWQTETTRSSAWENLGHNVKTCQMHQRDLGRSRSR